MAPASPRTGSRRRERRGAHGRDHTGLGRCHVGRGRGRSQRQPTGPARSRPRRLEARARAAHRRHRGRPRRGRAARGPRARPGVADFEAELDRLVAAYDLLLAAKDTGTIAAMPRPIPPARSGSRRRGPPGRWWCGRPGPNTMAASQATSSPIGSRPSAGPRWAAWSTPASTCPRAPGPRRCRSRSRRRSAGWSPSAAGWAATASGPASPGSVGWCSPPCAWSPRRRRPRPHRASAWPEVKLLELAVRWVPALVDDAELDHAGRRHARARRRAAPVPTPAPSPSPSSAPWSTPSSPTPPAGSSCRRRRPRPAPPPTSPRPFVTRLDGSRFEAPVARRRRACPKRLERWAKPVTGTARRPPRRAARPARLGRRLVPVGARPRRRGQRCCRSSWRWSTARAPSALADELARLERLLPVLLRPGALRRGQVYLSQDEAWELMTVTGPALDGRRLRRAGARAVAAQADARRCGCSPSPPATRWSAPTSSATCAGRRCSTTSS